MATRPTKPTDKSTGKGKKPTSKPAGRPMAPPLPPPFDLPFPLPDLDADARLPGRNKPLVCGGCRGRSLVDPEVLRLVVKRLHAAAETEDHPEARAGLAFVICAVEAIGQLSAGGMIDVVEAVRSFTDGFDTGLDFSAALARVKARREPPAAPARPAEKKAARGVVVPMVPKRKGSPRPVTLQNPGAKASPPKTSRPTKTPPAL